jgi:uncharacterized protein YjbI with pentapeptide repeats
VGDFYGVNLDGSELVSLEALLVNLENANLEGAHLQGANLQGANVKGTILENPKSKGAAP